MLTIKQHYETVKKNVIKPNFIISLFLWAQFKNILKKQTVSFCPNLFPTLNVLLPLTWQVCQMKPFPPIPAQVNQTLQMFQTVTSFCLWWKKKNSADTCVHTYTHSHKHMLHLWWGGQGGQPLIARSGCIIAWLKAVLQTHCAFWGRRGWVRAWWS